MVCEELCKVVQPFKAVSGEKGVKCSFDFPIVKKKIGPES